MDYRRALTQIETAERCLAEAERAIAEAVDLTTDPVRGGLRFVQYGAQGLIRQVGNLANLTRPRVRPEPPEAA